MKIFNILENLLHIKNKILLHKKIKIVNWEKVFDFILYFLVI